MKKLIKKKKHKRISLLMVALIVISTVLPIFPTGTFALANSAGTGEVTYETIADYQPVNGVDYVAALNKNGWTNKDFVITAEVQKEFVRIETAINNYDIATVTSNEKEEIKVLVQDMNVLLQLNNLTEEEKSVVGDLKTTATKLIEVVLTAQAALDAEEIKAVEGISKDTVRLTDKESLEKAKIALEAVLSEYNNHYTETEKQEITASIACVTQALESIKKIETTIDFISKLPSADSVNPDDKNNLLLWIMLLFISGFGVIGKIVYSAKKK